jgi:hypothetical protein
VRHRPGTIIGGLLLALVATVSIAAAQGPAAAGALTLNIANLGSTDYQVRMHAARLIRRTPGDEAVPALAEAVRRHDNEFVRYRSLVLLTSFNDPDTRTLVLDLMSDRSDRVREVVYKWLERHPDGRVAERLIAHLQTEVAEFVRPALVAALAAMSGERSVQRPMIAETARGLDFFRSAVIEALGRHGASYALDAIVGVARLVGPLQDDAVLAIGRIGGPDAAALLAELDDLTREAAVMRLGARCLIDDGCRELTALTTAASSPDSTPGEVRAAVDALSAVAQARREDALDALMTLARSDLMHDRVAIAWAGVALRQPEWSVAWLQARDEAARDVAIQLLKDGFDSLEEDFAEEQFFASVRAGYWRAEEASPGRALRATLIQRLEF